MCTCCPGVTIPKIIVRYAFLVFIVLLMVLVGITIWFAAAFNANAVLNMLKINSVFMAITLIFVVMLLILIVTGCLTWFCAGMMPAKIPFGICGCCMWFIFFVVAILFFVAGAIAKKAIDSICEDGGQNDF
jgi:hypothetical protein